jgi:hypothetical protein
MFLVSRSPLAPYLRVSVFFAIASARGCRDETVYDSNHASKKGDWFRNIASAARNMNHTIGMQLFDSDVSAVEGPKANYRIDCPLSDRSGWEGSSTLRATPTTTVGMRSSPGCLRPSSAPSHAPHVCIQKLDGKCPFVKSAPSMSPPSTEAGL